MGRAISGEGSREVWSVGDVDGHPHPAVKRNTLPRLSEGLCTEEDGRMTQ